MMKFYIISLFSSIRCPPGHYCKLKTETQFQYPCPDGTFNTQWGIERENQCSNCNAGYTCTGGDSSGDKFCPHGHYCLGGKSQCPTGEGTGTGNISPCKCPAGKFTEHEGATRKFIDIAWIVHSLSYIAHKICTHSKKSDQQLLNVLIVV